MRALRLVVLLTASCAGLLQAQTAGTRVLVHVDYITEKNLYISAGAGQGLFAGDTAVAYRSGAQQQLGRVVIVSSTRSRAVALMIDSLGIAIGDVLDLIPPPAALARLSAARVPADSLAAPRSEAAVQVQSTRLRTQPGVSLRGRLGLDFDALMSQSSFANSSVQRSTYTTPAARLRAQLTGLPGGMQLNTNLRVQYFGGLPGREELNVRIYQASLVREASFARFQLGRFYNPYESHSGYWDGALLRLGGNAVGAGVAFGYTPLAGTEAFTTAFPKTTAFIDAHQRGRTIRYDGSMSFNEQTSEFVPGRRNFLGVAQQLEVRGIRLTQRAQMGRTANEGWSLWQTQASASVNLGRPVQTFARYSAERTDLYSEQPGASPLRVRWSGGLSASIGGAYASAEGGRISSTLDSNGFVYQGSFLIPRALFGFGLGFSASRFEEGDVASTWLAPTLDRSFGPVRAHLAGQYSNSVFENTAFVQQGVELSVAVPLGQRAEATITAAHSRGSGSQNTRILLSIWQSF